ncbi:MAG: DUF512 domain-containing protein [Firmicutes bacterium]|nr:DUF512 domain-containing protein [Bacillota bacterium]
MEPRGIAGEIGIETGDAIVAVNGRAPRDVIDLRFLAADGRIEVEVEKRCGERVVYEIEKHPDEPLGVSFESDVFDGVKRCANSCPFCFIDGLPAGMRASLYLKDDDYRLSFLHGNFVTLTNMRDDEFARIVEQRLSPIYVSVHSTDPGVREYLLGARSARDVMERLEYLTSNGIRVHAQVVVCPGVNDEQHLDRTIEDLSGFWPGVASVGVVPVGLTRFQRRDCGIRAMSGEEMSRLIDWGLAAHARFRRANGDGFVFLADELFLATGREFPPLDYYGGFPQYENGIGIAPAFLDDLRRLRLPRSFSRGVSATAVCGRLAIALLRSASVELNRIRGVDVSVLPVLNRFFGETVSVSGLLTGRDIAAAVAASGGAAGRLIVVPAVSLRDGVFLDDMTLSDLETALGARVAVAGPSPKDLLERLKREDRGSP